MKKDSFNYFLDQIGIRLGMDIKNFIFTGKFFLFDVSNDTVQLII